MQAYVYQAGNDLHEGRSDPSSALTRPDKNWRSCGFLGQVVGSSYSTGVFFIAEDQSHGYASKEKRN